MRGNEEADERLHRVSPASVALCALVAVAAGCGGKATAAAARLDASVEPTDSDGSIGDDASLPVSPPDGCVGCPEPPVCPAGAPLSCYVNSNCPDGGTTSLSGTVYDPAGRNPLPNVAVFVPNVVSDLAPITPGTSACHSCETSIGDYATITLTDASGHFTLTRVPTGKNVPLVMQVGKWRRVVNVPSVADCASTPVAPDSSRLPRNQSEGSMPQMAVLTGGCDNVACFLRNVGIDPIEFASPQGGKRVDVYQGLGATGPGAPLSTATAGDCTTAACPLWSSKQALERYDRVFLGCECDEHNETKPPASLQAMHDWLAEGGEVFATHSQATWFKNGPVDFQYIASWTSGPASGAAGPFAVVTASPAGRTFETWLTTVGATGASGVVALDPADVSTSVTTAPESTAWIDDTSTATDGAGAQSGNVKALSYQTHAPEPDGAPYAPSYCGRINFADIHPGGGQALQGAGSDGSSAPAAVPAACANGELSAGDKVLEYLLFNQSICVQTMLPPPPPPPPPG